MNTIGKLKRSLLPTDTDVGFFEIRVFIFLFENSIKFGIAVGLAYQSPPPLYFNTATS